MRADPRFESPDVFLSYAREDTTAACELVRVLEDEGWTTWWDREIKPGQDFELEIDMALAQSKVVVVLWSNFSVSSNWVRNEAKEAKEQNKIIPVLLDDSRVPLSFRSLSTIELNGWPNKRSSQEISQFKSAIARVIQSGGSGRVLKKPDPADELSLSVRVAKRVADLVSQQPGIDESSALDNRTLLFERCITDICLDILAADPGEIEQQLGGQLLKIGAVLGAQYTAISTVDFSRMAVTRVLGVDPHHLTSQQENRIAAIVNEYCTPAGDHNLDLNPENWPVRQLLCLPLKKTGMVRDFAWFICLENSSFWDMQLQERLIQLCQALEKMRGHRL